MRRAHAGFALRTSLITLGIIIGFVAVLFTKLPRGFSDDLAKIGHGSNIAVVIHDKNTVSSQNLMSVLNQIRSDYTGKVEFLVADIETENGKALVREQQVNSGVLVLFGPDGTRLGLLSSTIDDKALRAALDNTFALKP